MRVFYDRDLDLEIIRGKRVAIIGYGAQGRAHALNLRESGVADIIVGLREGSSSAERAKAEGFRVASVPEAVAAADVIMLLAPDEAQGRIYAADIAPALAPGKTLLFAHGFAIHFKLIEPRADIDVAMVAPKGAGAAVRGQYVEGGGVPCLVAVHQNANGRAFELALSYAGALGAGRSGIIETNFREECETDLFSEQTVLCGGMPALIRAAFETLVEAGYSPEIAYIECLIEVKLIADLIYERGLAGINGAISNTAEYGQYVAGPRMVTEETRAEMKRVLADIQSGRFAKNWMAEYNAGLPTFRAARAAAAAHPIEEAGVRLRAMVKLT